MDVERTMEFLLEQQTRFAAQEARHEARQEKFEDDLLRINAVLLDVASTQERGNEIMATLSERQLKSEELLQALITTVERHIGNHN